VELAKGHFRLTNAFEIYYDGQRQVVIPIPFCVLNDFISMLSTLFLPLYN
jgi:hypothetical protein